MWMNLSRERIMMKHESPFLENNMPTVTTSETMLRTTFRSLSTTTPPLITMSVPISASLQPAFNEEKKHQAFATRLLNSFPRSFLSKKTSTQVKVDFKSKAITIQGEVQANVQAAFDSVKKTLENCEALMLGGEQPVTQKALLSLALKRLDKKILLGKPDLEFRLKDTTALYNQDKTSAQFNHWRKFAKKSEDLVFQEESNGSISVWALNVEDLEVTNKILTWLSETLPDAAVGKNFQASVKLGEDLDPSMLEYAGKINGELTAKTGCLFRFDKNSGGPDEKMAELRVWHPPMISDQEFQQVTKKLPELFKAEWKHILETSPPRVKKTKTNPGTPAAAGAAAASAVEGSRVLKLVPQLMPLPVRKIVPLLTSLSPDLAAADDSDPLNDSNSKTKIQHLTRVTKSIKAIEVIGRIDPLKITPKVASSSISRSLVPGNDRLANVDLTNITKLSPQFTKNFDSASPRLSLGGSGGAGGFPPRAPRFGTPRAPSNERSDVDDVRSRGANDVTSTRRPFGSSGGGPGKGRFPRREFAEEGGDAKDKLAAGTTGGAGPARRKRNVDGDEADQAGGGDSQAYEDNAAQVAEPMLSQKVRWEMYSKQKENPTEWTVERLCNHYEMSSDRVRAVLTLMKAREAFLAANPDVSQEVKDFEDKSYKELGPLVVDRLPPPEKYRPGWTPFFKFVAEDYNEAKTVPAKPAKVEVLASKISSLKAAATATMKTPGFNITKIETRFMDLSFAKVNGAEKIAFDISSRHKRQGTAVAKI